jgi:hypothetical protein
MYPMFQDSGFVRPLKPSSMKTQKSATDFLSFSLSAVDHPQA